MTDAIGQLRALLARLPYAGFLGVEAQVHDGELVLALPFKPTLVGNPLLPALHGGALGGLLEIAAMTQLSLIHETEQIRKPIDVMIDYLRSARAQTVYAQAHVKRIGRRVANVHAEAWQDMRDKPVAILHAHFLVDEAAE